jgi:3-deoxy-D-manno-octulosonate 8-phosphate phosphatase (KDO 8-P phosphatase)
MSNITRDIKLVVFDFDGTLTDGTVYFSGQGTELVVHKGYNVRDGTGIKLLQKSGIKIGVISGFPENKSTRDICKHLDINYISMGSNDKVAIINTWISELSITLDNVAFMGDDLNDLLVMSKVKMSGCPSDAAQECISLCRFRSKYLGGHGAVREFCDWILTMISFPMVSGLVCVKYTSNRCPMKNIRQFGNSSLLEIKLNKLLSLKFLDNVVLNTESDIIIEFITKRIKNPRLIIVKRIARLALDDISNREFCTAVTIGTHPHVLYSPVTMPFITENTYDSMYARWTNHTNANTDSVVLVADGKQGSGHLEESHTYCFGASLMNRRNIIGYGDFIGHFPHFQKCTARERIDIDTPEEFETALYHYYNPDAIYTPELNDLYSINNSKIPPRPDGQPRRMMRLSPPTDDETETETDTDDPDYRPWT